MSKCQTSLEKLSEGRILSVFKLRHHSPIVIKYFSWSSSSSSSNEWHLKGSRRQMDLEVHRRTPACEIISIFSFNFFIITINIITGSLSPSLNHFFCGFFSVKFVMISIYMKTCTLLCGLCHPSSISMLFWLLSRLVCRSVRATESLNFCSLNTVHCSDNRVVGTNYTTHTNVDIRTRPLKSGKLHNAFFSEDKSIVYIKRFPPFQILQDPPIYFCSKLFPVDPRKKASCSLPQFSQESISSAFRHHFSPPILQDSKWRNKEQERMRPAALCTLLHITAMWWLHANVQLICAKLPMLEQECVSLMPRRSQDVLSWPPTPNPSKFARNPTKKRNPAKMRNPRKMSKSGRTEMRPSLTASLDLVNLGNILASYFADVCLGSIC